MATAPKKTTRTPAKPAAARKAPVKRRTPGEAEQQQSAVPANVKKPSDHRPARDDVAGPKDITVEWHGHSYTIDRAAFDDLEVIDLFLQIEEAEEDGDENRQGMLSVRAARKILAGDVYKAYLANERGEDGRVKLTGFLEFFQHVMGQVDQGNS